MSSREGKPFPVTERYPTSMRVRTCSLEIGVGSNCVISRRVLTAVMTSMWRTSLLEWGWPSRWPSPCAARGVFACPCGRFRESQWAGEARPRPHPGSSSVFEPSLHRFDLPFHIGLAVPSIVHFDDARNANSTHSCQRFVHRQDGFKDPGQVALNRGKHWVEPVLEI